jgi:DNA polymerase kappa
VFLKPDFRKYEAASAATREVFRQYDPHFEAGSLDEAYLDVTDYCAAHGMTGEQVRPLIHMSDTLLTRCSSCLGMCLVKTKLGGCSAMVINISQPAANQLVLRTCCRRLLLRCGLVWRLPRA